MTSSTSRRAFMAGVAFAGLSAAFLPNAADAQTPDRLATPQEVAALIKAHENIYRLPAGKTIESFVAENADKPVFVLYEADWCIYCKNLHPIMIEEFARKFPKGEAQLLIVDVEQHKQYKRGIPQIQSYRGSADLGNTLTGMPGIQEYQGRKVVVLAQTRGALQQFLQRGVDLFANKKAAPAPSAP